MEWHQGIVQLPLGMEYQLGIVRAVPAAGDQELLVLVLGIGPVSGKICE